MAERLPALVRRYLDRAGLPDGDVPRQVRLAQRGEMWQKPGGRAMRFEAVEELAVEKVAFSWRARFPIAPLLSLRVTDAYAAGEGRLEVRLLGLGFRSSAAPGRSSPRERRFATWRSWRGLRTR